MKKRTRLFKYDIVISCSEMDIDIARKLQASITGVGLDSYFYREKNQYGENLEDVTNYTYYTGANHALVIVSKNYLKGHWAQKEWEVLLEARREKRVRKIFLVILDQTRLPGQIRGNVYQSWRNNPGEIADLIHDQMPFRNFWSFLRVTVIILFVILFTLLFKFNS